MTEEIVLIELGNMNSHIGNNQQMNPIINYENKINDFDIERNLSNLIQSYEKQRQQLYNEEQEQYKLSQISLCQSQFNGLQSKQIIAEYLFEYQNIDSLLLGYEGTMSILSYGQQTGTLLNLGHKKTYSICYKETQIINQTYIQQNLGGEFLDQLIIRDFGITEHLNYFKQNALRLSRQIEKENLYFQQQNYERMKDQYQIRGDQRQFLNFSQIELPDSTIVQLNENVCKIPQNLFQSEYYMGIHQQIISSIFQSSQQDKKKVSQNIFLSGKLSNLYDLSYKIKQELDKIMPNTMPYNLFHKTDCVSNSYKGLYALTNTSLQKQNSITRQEFQEHGIRVILQREFRQLQK